MTTLLRVEHSLPASSDQAAGPLTSIHVLRMAWLSAADVAQQHNVPGLHDIVEKRLDRISRTSSCDEHSLLAIAEECQAMIAVVASERDAQDVGRRLRRGIYEFLLACDAHSERSEPPPVEASETPPRFALVDMATVRRVVGAHLAQGRYHEAAAVLSRVSRNQCGTELAEIACSAGVACRAARQRSAAAACFQASCVADPEYAGDQDQPDDLIG